MKAELWQFDVTDNVLSMIHGQFTTIKELYFPKTKICLNFAGGLMHCFYGEKTRHEKGKKIKSVNISDDLYESILGYLTCRNNLEAYKDWFDEISS
jgi:hypothetical protein